MPTGQGAYVGATGSRRAPGAWARRGHVGVSPDPSDCAKPAPGQLRMGFPISQVDEHVGEVGKGRLSLTVSG